MAESSTQSKKLQWKWVGISFLMYVVFYLLPLVILGKVFGINNQALFGIWVFGGVIIVAAVAGYLSEGVTIWEPAIAGAGLVFLWVIFILLFVHRHYSISRDIVPLLIAISIVFLLSLLGAWFGERAQKLWKTKTPESN
jgi:hypothetical protein